MPLAPNTRLGTYEILAPLGAGGMGEVYRARDVRLGRDVAVKVLPADVASHPDRLARFEREARTVAGLNHPNIVTLYSVEDEDGLRFLTMELVDGQTLSSLVAASGLPLPRVLDLAIPLTDALVAAHERGVVHRDLKPGNIMVTRDGRVKVLDFGLAKLAQPDSDLDLTRAATLVAALSGAGQVVGTVPYMAPEQIRGEAVDARSDLFSLGILLYEIATGRRPFGGDSAADVSSAILRDAPVPMARVRGDLPADFERIVGRLLEKNPRERFQTALDVSNELRRLRRELERLDRGATAPPAADAAVSIAVLPFVNRSRDEEDEYFSDGLADELINVLAKIKGLRVSARASSFHFKGKGAPLAEVGQALNVSTVLDGSVRKSGNRVRISVQLVKVPDGYHLWSETYDRTLDDIFAVQDDIAQSVVKELRTALLGAEADSDASGQARAEVARAAKGRGTDPEAHRLYLMARHLMDRWTTEDATQARDYLRQALDRDPENALAWAELARVFSFEAGIGTMPIHEGYARAREAAEKALALEPDLAHALVELGSIKATYDYDWKGAETLVARAMRVAPGDASVVRRCGTAAFELGRPDEAVTLLNRSLELDPLASPSYQRLGLAYDAVGRHAEAEAAYRKAMELSPRRSTTRACLAFNLTQQGRTEEALGYAEAEPVTMFRLWASTIAHHGAGRHAEAAAALELLIRDHAEEAGFQIAELWALREDRDRAFEWLERAYAGRDGGLTETRSSILLRPLHGDPRWLPFLRKLGFEV